MSVLHALLARVWGFVQVLGNASQFHSAGSYKPVISNDTRRIVHVLQSTNHTAKSMNHTAKLTNHTAKLMNYTAKSINHTASNQRTTSPCQRKTYILHRAGQCILDNTHKLHWSDREMEADQRRAAMLVHAKKSSQMVGLIQGSSTESQHGAIIIL